MAWKTIIFDLDGTLTDSAEGITNSVKLVMNHFGIPVPGMDVLRTFVGPPLHDMFVKYGVPEDRIDEAFSVFRGRYLAIGKFENKPYPGIPEMLQTLKSKGYTLYVATSKPEPQAIEILTHFNLAEYFDCICGATLDESRVDKEDVLCYLLDKAPNDTPVMVGDTVYDVVGAKALDIPTIGVSWGYGSVTDMQEAGAIKIANTTDELLDTLTSTC